MTRTTILVVEDNEKNLKLVRDVLEFAGFDVIAAASAEEGVAMAMDHPPDLVLMDLQLPGVDGTEAMRRLRGSPRTNAVPVVALTALAMQHDRQRAMDAGFDGYLEKPISVPRLPAQVRSFLRSKEATP